MFKAEFLGRLLEGYNANTYPKQDMLQSSTKVVFRV